MARRGGRGGMAYDYSLGLAQLQEQQREARAREAEQERRNAAQIASENFKNSLAEQGEKLRASKEAFETAYKLHQDQKQERALNHAALFMQGYNLIPENAPNRREQVNWLMSKLPEAMKVPEIEKMISADNARLEPKAGLTKDEQQFLRENGPKSKNWATLQKEAADPDNPNHVTSAINYGRAWDLLKKEVGMQSGTPTGIGVDDYVKNIQSTFQKLPNGQPNPAYQAPVGQAPPPSTPAPQNAEAWSNAQVPDVAMPQVPNQPAAAQPAAQPTAPASDNAREYIRRLGFKTSDAGAAASATNSRNELNDMLNQSPETQFVAPQPQPTPTPTPVPNKEQYYTA